LPPALKLPTTLPLLLSYFILGEPIGIYHVVGGALIVAGIHLASRPDSRPPAHAEA
jgi:drug/metabolite transporter (DMT)-like permease